jgi:phospholipid/cholesterol/gamma-HCH transport system permease protein
LSIFAPVLDSRANLKYRRYPYPASLTFLDLIPFERQVKTFLVEVGRYSMLLFQSFRSVLEFGTYRENLLKQMVRVGVDSLPIVALAAAFSGAVTTIQTAYQLISPFIPRSVIGGVVVPSMILELGVVTTALVLAGRVGARIAAELGTMRVTDQVDALEAMGLNSVAYLVVPRVLAGVLMFPVLYAVACFVGIGGGILAGELGGHLPAQEFIEGGRAFFKPYDVVFGVIKSLVCGFIITSISCSKGYFTTGGAEGVGKSTTQAAVASCVMVLLADYVLAIVLL